MPTTTQVIGLASRAAVKAQVEAMAPPRPASRGAKKAPAPARANCSSAKGPRMAATASARPPKTSRPVATMATRAPTTWMTRGWAWANLVRRSEVAATRNATSRMTGRNDEPAAIAAPFRPCVA
ncbi:hypothetical protein D3C86_1637640 [compost metagenome]